MHVLAAYRELKKLAVQPICAVAAQCDTTFEGAAAKDPNLGLLSKAITSLSGGAKVVPSPDTNITVLAPSDKCVWLPGPLLSSLSVVTAASSKDYELPDQDQLGCSLRSFAQSAQSHRGASRAYTLCEYRHVRVSPAERNKARAVVMADPSGVSCEQHRGGICPDS